MTSVARNSKWKVLKKKNVVIKKESGLKTDSEIDETMEKSDGEVDDTVSVGENSGDSENEEVEEEEEMNAQNGPYSLLEKEP